jgi:hypothetical protein
MRVLAGRTYPKKGSCGEQQVPKDKETRRKLFSPVELQLLLTMLALSIIVALILIAKHH